MKRFRFLYAAISRSWDALCTAMASVSSCAIGLFILIYFIRLREAESFLSKMNEPIANMSFLDDGATTNSSLGSSQVKWKVFDEVLEFSRVWLLEYGKGGFLTLRVASMRAETMRLIKLKMNGA